MINEESQGNGKGDWAADVTGHGQKVKGIFFVKKSRVMSHRNKAGSYLLMVLGDRSGEINAVFWSYNPEKFFPVRPGDFVRLTGMAMTYNTSLQVRIDRIDPISSEEIHEEDYLIRGTADTVELMSEVMTKISEVSDPDIRRLLEYAFSDEGFGEAFMTVPAAMTWHHSYAGGLLEHSVNVLRICHFVQKMYPLADRDLLTAGALLHDAGKIRELTPGPAFGYTDEGKLLGHISMGFAGFEEMVYRIGDFPPSLKLKIGHIILSHHGMAEYGSPKRPKTVEAMIVRLADDLDAQVAGFTKVINDSINGVETWSEVIPLLDRPIFLG